jgi:hypothetical protein
LVKKEEELVPLDITASAAAAIQEKLKNSARGFTFILLFTTRRRRRRRCAPFFFFILLFRLSIFQL